MNQRRDMAWKYKRFMVDYFLCFYCGANAATEDHQPPLSRVDDFVSLYGDSSHLFKLVPCCTECNALLGANLHRDLEERHNWLKMRLRKKYKRQLAAGDWGVSEMKELGRNLRSDVKSAMVTKRRVLRRLAYTAGLDLFVLYKAEHATLAILPNPGALPVPGSLIVSRRAVPSPQMHLFRTGSK